MSDSLGLPREQEAAEEVGRALYAEIPPGAEAVVLSVSMVSSTSSSKLRALFPDGRRESLPGRDSFDLPLAMKALRKIMYRPGSGTWFGMEMTVTSEGGMTTRFNYDDEPDFGLGGVDSIVYATDQEKFPRDQDKQPEWLKHQLAERRACVRLSSWRLNVANGDDDGADLALRGTSFEQRSFAPGHLGGELNNYDVEIDARLEIRIELSEVAVAFGQPGGGLQVRFFNKNNLDDALSVSDLMTRRILRWLPYHGNSQSGRASYVLRGTQANT